MLDKIKTFLRYYYFPIIGIPFMGYNIFRYIQLGNSSAASEVFIQLGLMMIIIMDIILIKQYENNLTIKTKIGNSQK